MECSSKNTTYVSVRKTGGEQQAEGRETYLRMEQVIAVIPIICWHQFELMEIGLPWMMAVLPMPRYQQLLSPSAGRLGAAVLCFLSGHHFPSAAITHSRTGEEAVCPLKVGIETLRCSDQILLNSGQCFPPSQYLFCACQGKEDFYNNEQTQKNAFYF